MCVLATTTRVSHEESAAVSQDRINFYWFSAAFANSVKNVSRIAIFREYHSLNPAMFYERRECMNERKTKQGGWGYVKMQGKDIEGERKRCIVNERI